MFQAPTRRARRRLTPGLARRARASSAQPRRPPRGEMGLFWWGRGAILPRPVMLLLDAIIKIISVHSSVPPPTMEPNTGRLGHYCPAVPGVTEEYTWPSLAKVVTTWLSHADQPIDLSEPREAARLGRNKGPKRRVASPSAQLRHRSTSRTPVSQHFGSPHTANMWEDMKGGMYQPVLKVGTPCNLTHSWGWMAIDSPGVHLPFAWCCFSSTGVSITPSSLKSIQ